MNTTLKRPALAIALLFVVLLSVWSPVHAQQQQRRRITIPGQLPSLAYNLVRHGAKKAAGGLVADVVLGRIYSEKRGYYGNKYLPAYLRARRAY